MPVPRSHICTSEFLKDPEEESGSGIRGYIVTDVTYQEIRVAVSVITSAANHFLTTGGQLAVSQITPGPAQDLRAWPVAAAQWKSLKLSLRMNGTAGRSKGGCL